MVATGEHTPLPPPLTPDERVIDTCLRRLLGPGSRPDPGALSERIAAALARGDRPRFATHLPHPTPKEQFMPTPKSTTPGPNPAARPRKATASHSPVPPAMRSPRNATPIDDGSSTRWLVAAIGTGVLALLLLVVINIMGNTPNAVNDRFGTTDATVAMANTAPQRVRASNANAASIGPSMNRSHSGRSAVDSNDPDLEDRMRNYDGMLGRQGWNMTDLSNRVGDPERVIGDYLRGQYDKEQIARYDLVADVQAEQDGQTRRSLFYVVEPYDLMQGPRKAGPKQLLRGVFVPVADAARGLQQQIEALTRTMAAARNADEQAAMARELERLQDLQRSLNEGSMWSMIDFGPVQPADPDYARHMKR